ncbi:hypothetical protein ACFYXC_37230 [Streptomyces sp. NPDC002701]
MITAQQAGWEKLMPAQQYLLEALGIEPPAEDETPAPVRRSTSRPQVPRA